MLKYFVSVCLIVASIAGIAQEINARVQVNSQQIQGSEKTVFNTMQQNITEFVNSTRWTTDVFTQNEKIEVNILINITERVSNEEFKGTFQISARRPVYGSSFNTTLFTNLDNDFHFRFQQFEPLTYSETSYISNLTSVVAFYMYFIIGLDYDSFSMEGGSTYLRKALTVVNNAQSAEVKGWKASEGSNNRFWLIENYLNDNQFRNLRKAMYLYHLEGFDAMAKDVAKGRTKVTEALTGLEKVHQFKPLSYNMQLFFNAKADEIVQLYAKAEPNEKVKIVNLLNKIDPGNQNKYQKILK